MEERALDVHEPPPHIQIPPTLRTPSHVRIPMNTFHLNGDLSVPPKPRGMILFAHGSGKCRRSTRNQYFARQLQHSGFATLLVDLLTPDEAMVDHRTGHLRFDTDLLAQRLVVIIDWIRNHPDLSTLPIGIFGASTGGAAALTATGARPTDVVALVSRGRRHDFVRARITVPTLLIAGSRDVSVIRKNEVAMASMPGVVKQEIIPDASYTCEEPEALKRVAALTTAWFSRYVVHTDSDKH
jgi:putative phosphoribosyl transferase